ncbi:spliceosome-associated protein CWC27 homolog [Haliotis rubra]|uniref:spliceosome-associated protein CWC27 homolog n=1 Tax=Haliotis rubra TaxID=36100 RepID=UPI001EE5B957|nr:spliceosome-associated protein CWC27 homolog [Haliotis rubra]
MSNIYIQEPPTNGKVLLSTTVGDIDIELWSKEAPKACRNFVQLLMEGYYDGTIFHRMVKDFIVQGGDPTGTGEGGESIYGEPFKDEVHSRLRFVRRGLVAMANAGANDNGSQFFFTLGPAPELYKKHTIFGKVAGNTLFNMIKLQDVETDGTDRPLYPHKILKGEILSNPFDDIEPRVLKKKKQEGEETKKHKSKSKATKNFSLLSFGEEAEEDEEQTDKASKTMRGKSKSSHDLIDDPHLSSVPALDTEERPDGKKRKSGGETEGSDTGEDSKEKSLETVRKKLKTDETDKKKDVSGKEDKKKEDKKKGDSDRESEKTKLDHLEELKKESKQLQKELSESKRKSERKADEKEEKSTKEAKKDIKSEGKTKDSKDKGKKGADIEMMPKVDMLEEYKQERQKYKDLRQKQSKKGSSREADTLAMLAKFQNRLENVKKLTSLYEDEEEETKKEKKEEKTEADEEQEDDDMTWMGHKLHFEDKSRKVIDANVTDEDRYEIYDPRNPLNKRRREASKQSSRDRR